MSGQREPRPDCDDLSFFPPLAVREVLARGGSPPLDTVPPPESSSAAADRPQAPSRPPPPPVPLPSSHFMNPPSGATRIPAEGVPSRSSRRCADKEIAADAVPRALSSSPPPGTPPSRGRLSTPHLERLVPSRSLAAPAWLPGTPRIRGALLCRRPKGGGPGAPPVPPAEPGQRAWSWGSRDPTLPAKGLPAEAGASALDAEIWVVCRTCEKTPAASNGAPRYGRPGD